MIIRKLTRPEIEKVLPLQIQVVSEIVRRDFFSPGDENEVKSIQNSGAAFGAFDDGELIGYAAVCWCGDWLKRFETWDKSSWQIRPNDTIGEIGYVVRAKYQGQGIAGKLVKELLNSKETLQKVNVIIGTVHPENIPSQKILLTAGFERKKERKKETYTQESDYKRDVFIKKI